MVSLSTLRRALTFCRHSLSRNVLKRDKDDSWACDRVIRFFFYFPACVSVPQRQRWPVVGKPRATPLTWAYPWWPTTMPRPCPAPVAPPRTTRCGWTRTRRWSEQTARPTRPRGSTARRTRASWSKSVSEHVPLHWSRLFRIPEVWFYIEYSLTCDYRYRNFLNFFLNLFKNAKHRFIDLIKHSDVMLG